MTPSAGRSAGTLFKEVAAGDSRAIRECLAQFGPLVWSLARRLSKRSADAEDAVQDIFLEIWRHADRYDETRGSPQTFVATIARRRLVDRLRRSTSEPNIDPDVDVVDCAASFEHTHQWGVALDGEHALRAMGALRPEFRRVLELAFLGGLTQAEIATQLGAPLGTIKSHTRRALLQLREMLTLEARVEGVRDFWRDATAASPACGLTTTLAFEAV